MEVVPSFSNDFLRIVLDNPDISLDEQPDS